MWRTGAREGIPGSLSPCGRGLGRGGLDMTCRLVRGFEPIGSTPHLTLSRKGRGRNINISVVIP